jgi:serine/threonine protein kinase
MLDRPRINHSSDNPSLDIKKKKKTRSDGSNTKHNIRSDTNTGEEPIAVRQSPDPSKQTKSRETHETNLSDDNSKRDETVANIISTRTTRGHSYMAQNEYGNAEQEYKQALAFSTLSDPKRPETTAACHYNLAQCYKKQEKYNEAKQEYKQALAFSKLFNLKSREVAICYYYLAQCYDKLEKYDKMEQPYKEALAIYEQLDPKSRETATCHCYLAQCYDKQKKFHEATQEYNKALAFYKQLDPKSREVANCHCYLAQCYDKQEKYDMAEQPYKEALAFYEQLDPKPPELVTCRLKLVDCYMKQGKDNEVRQAIRHMQDTYEKKTQQLQKKTQQLQKKYDQQEHQEQLARGQQEHQEQLARGQQEHQEQLANIQQKLDQAHQEIDSLQRQLQEERSKVQSKGIFSTGWGSKSIKTQLKHDKKWQENQGQLTKAQHELTLEKQKNARLKRQLQETQEALDQAQPNNTSSRSTDKEEVSTSKPLALRELDDKNAKPLALRELDDKNAKPLALRELDDKNAKPLALRELDDKSAKPLALNEKDPKLPAQFETKSDSASTSVQDVNMPLTIHCALGEYGKIEILSGTANYIIYLAERGPSSDNKKSHQELVFKAPRIDSEEHLDRLKNEAKILKMFKDHPNVVSYQDFNEYGAPPFLAMDYAQGGTLEDVHDAGECLDIKLIIYYLKQIATTVDAIHKQKVIHLDLKPSNIFLKGVREPLERELLIGDFGCARVVKSEPLQLADDDIVGTTEYISPEYLNCNPTYASDLYSIAVMIYEWISGHYPFESQFSRATARQHAIQFQLLNNSPEPLYGRVPGVTRAIEKVILKGLAKDPKDRYRNVTAFAEALELAYHLKSYKIPEMVSAWISPLFDNQRPQVVAAKIDKWLDYAYQPAKMVVSETFQWTGWYQTTNGSSQTTLFQDIKKAIGTVGYPLRRIAQLSRSAKKLEQIKPLPGRSLYFKKRYAATTVQMRSPVYTIHESLGCVVDATQMLLRDQGIDVEDGKVKDELEYNAENGSYTGKMPGALKRLGYIEYQLTKGRDIEYLKDALKSSYAVVATINLRCRGGKHVVAVDKIGMDRNGNGPFVYIRDGSYNKPYKVALDVWEEVWTGESIVPNIKD